MKEKVCSKCGGGFPLTGEFWHKRSASKDGLFGTCTKCCKEAKAKRYKENKTEIDKKTKDYRKNNPEKVKGGAARYRKNNREKIKKDSSLYRKNNPEKVAMQSASGRKRNAHRIKEQRAKAINNLTDPYIRVVLKSAGYTPEQMTQELIEAHRQKIVSKRLKIPIGTDITRDTKPGKPGWVK